MLHFVLRDDGEDVAVFMADRLVVPGVTGKPTYHQVSTYDILLTVDGYTRKAKVRHKYGDGPLALVKKALDAILEAK